ncbi:MAG: Flp family type IVb pilin [Chloroflexota bacterium]|nr:Flp family type IVb pilin [Chloroflexota bacterium]
MMYLYVYLSNVLRDLKEEAGQGMAEYGLILALVAIAVIIALGALSGGIQDVFNRVNTELTNALPAGS